jgi:multimeric flavodoxin WrbA
MKVVGISGSPRKDGNTAIIIRTVFQELEKEGIETELLQLAGQTIRGCTACYQCAKNKDQKCINRKDLVNECIAKMAEADGIILGSPTYYADVTAEMKALIDRAGIVAKYNGYLFKHKVGAAVTAVNRGGAIRTFDTMNHFLHNMQMYLVGASYWNMVYGLDIGAVEKDEEGLLNMRVLGENMAFLLKKLNN